MFFDGDFVVYNGPKQSASSVPKYKKAVMCVLEKIYVLDKLLSGMNYRAVGHEFNINESTIYIKQGVFNE